MEQFKVRFSSRPTNAELFAAGSKKSLCVTPCTMAIDPEDGGSKTRRIFVLRREGFKDETVRIDLARPPKDLDLALERLPEE